MNRTCFDFARRNLVLRFGLAATCSIASSAVFAGLCLSNEHVQLAFDDAGCISSIRETASGRELIATKVPFVSVLRAARDGRAR